MSALKIPVMDSAICQLDLDVLERMYEEESRQLNESLLAGSSWESLRERKQIVVDLAVAIYKKRNPQHFNTAEFHQNNDRGTSGPYSAPDT